MNLAQNKQRRRWYLNRYRPSAALSIPSSILSTFVGNYRRLRRRAISAANRGQPARDDAGDIQLQSSSSETRVKSEEQRKGRLFTSLREKWRFAIPQSTKMFFDSLMFVFGFALITRLLAIKKKRQRSADISRRTLRSVYTKLPWNVTSRLVGRLCNTEIPKFARRSVYNAFIRTTKVNLNEAIDTDLRNYASLSAFFQRRLKPELRQVDHSALIASPCDGTVVHHGMVQCDRVYQIKSARYRLAEFLGPATWNAERSGDCVSRISGAIVPGVEPDFDQYLANVKSNPANELFYVNIYLAPRDYHRFHSPVDWTVHFRRHCRGALLSVHERVAGSFENLYTFNERVVYVGQWQHGFFSMSAVGATNVGSIQTLFDKELVTNKRRRWNDPHAHERFFENGVALKKGDEFGSFNFGSTIVLVFEAPPDSEFAFDSKRFPIRFGEALLLNNKCDVLSSDDEMQ